MHAYFSTPPGTEDLLAFLEQETVTRQEVLSRLGEPSAVFENSRVLTYRLSRGREGYSVQPHSNSWEGIRYDLVLVFDDEGVLRQRSTAVIRP